MSSDLKQQLHLLLAEVFQLPPEAITPDLGLGRIPQWDSMGHMSLMMALEARYGVEINTDTIGSLNSLPAILEHLETRHGG